MLFPKKAVQFQNWFETPRLLHAPGFINFLPEFLSKLTETFLRQICGFASQGFIPSLPKLLSRKSTLASTRQPTLFGPQLGRRGHLRSEEAEIAITTAFLRRAFSICAVKGQAFSLLGRLEGLGAGAAAAQGRRSQAARQEQLWRRQRQAHALCVRQGRDILRRGQIHFP